MVDRISDGSLNRFTYFFPKNLPTIHSVIDQYDNYYTGMNFPLESWTIRVCGFSDTKLSEVGADGKRRLRLGCMKKSGSLPQIIDLGIPYFFTCHTCLTSPQTSVLNVSRKYPGREKPTGFKPKGKELRYL